MARIVLACAGSYGDLFPYLGLARGLAARGHSPIIATSPHYRAHVESLGLTFASVRPDLDPSDPALLGRVMDPVKGSEVVIRDLAVPALRDSYDDLSRLVRGADLLVTHPIVFAGPIVGEQLGLPWISTVLSPVSFFSIYDCPVLPPAPALWRFARLGSWTGRLMIGLARSITRPWTAPVHAFRAELGLPPAGEPLYEGQFSPYGTLALYSSVLGGPQPDWPPKTLQTGFVFHQSGGDTPDALREFLDAGEPPIVFTLGSSAVGAAGTFYERSAAAAVALGRRAVLMIGSDPRNRPSGALLRGVLAVDYAPHDALFARAAAIVHHGGIGTTGQALRSGKPMLVVPHAHDQPDNAFRVSRLGVARTLDAQRYTTDRAIGHLRALLETPSYRARAAEVGRQVAGERGTDIACDALITALR